MKAVVTCHMLPIAEVSEHFSKEAPYTAFCSKDDLTNLGTGIIGAPVSIYAEELLATTRTCISRLRDGFRRTPRICF